MIFQMDSSSVCQSSNSSWAADGKSFTAAPFPRCTFFLYQISKHTSVFLFFSPLDGSSRNWSLVSSLDCLSDIVERISAHPGLGGDGVVPQRPTSPLSAASPPHWRWNKKRVRSAHSRLVFLLISEDVLIKIFIYFLITCAVFPFLCSLSVNQWNSTQKKSLVVDIPGTTDRGPQSQWDHKDFRSNFQKK